MAKTKFSILNFLCKLKKRNGETLIPCKKCAHLKDMLHKELLQILVGVVDAQLLEAVVLEVLEAEDVEDADGLAVGAALPRLVDGVVDLVDDPDEEAAVDALDEGVAHIHRLVLGERGRHRLAGREEGAGGERDDQVLGRELQQLGHLVHHTLRRDLRRVQVVDRGGL